MLRNTPSTVGRDEELQAQKVPLAPSSAHSFRAKKATRQSQQRKKIREKSSGFNPIYWVIVIVVDVILLADIYYLYYLSENHMDPNASSAGGILPHDIQQRPPLVNHPDIPADTNEHDPVSSDSKDHSSKSILEHFAGKEPLLEIALQAGVKPQEMVDDEDHVIDQLPTWKQVEKLYGKEPKIIGLDRCEAFRQNVDPKMKFIGVAGPFNSGTNLAAELIIHNCQIQERMDYAGQESKGMRWQDSPFCTFCGYSWMIMIVPWGKHTPASFREEHLTKHDRDVPIDNTLAVVMIRDPYQWAQSMCRHAYAAHWNHTRDHCPNIVPNQDDKARFPELEDSEYVPVHVKYAAVTTEHDSMMHFYNDWYNMYMNATFPRLIVRYEDLIFRGKEVTQAICSCAGGVERNDRPPGFRHVRESAKLGTAAHGKFKTNLIGALIRYGTDEHKADKMSPEDLEAAQAILDPTLMQSFAYEHPNEKE
eukprot:Nitzschia sp. Nitz4//scaffold118_size93875//74617//76434//NITZ4_004800-RA/size93875-augustus-gene-0.46-mRNA-1//1//CDS//3329533760//7511//frame0